MPRRIVFFAKELNLSKTKGRLVLLVALFFPNPSCALELVRALENSDNPSIVHDCRLPKPFFP